MKRMSALVVAIVAGATLAVAGQTNGVAERFTDRTTVTLENYDTQPVLLQSVKRQRASD